MKYQIPGTLFYLYLILAGVERFLVEMIRVNPKVVFGLKPGAADSIIYGCCRNIFVYEK
jgi:prolipoprotein diacylglyceryltransferase